MRTPYFAAAAIGFALAGCAMGGDPGSTVPHGEAASSARAPLSVKPTIRPSVLYYADNANTVYAVSQGASGSTLPARTIYPSSFYQASIVSLATLADGRLAVAQDQMVSSTVRQCRIVIEPANANGNPYVTNDWCEPNESTVPMAVARNTFGGVDVLYNNITEMSEPIRRFAGDGSIVSTLQPATNTEVLATDAAGNDYIVGHFTPTLHVIEYAATATSPANTLADFPVPLGNNAWGSAVAPDNTLYLINGEFPNQTIVAIVGNAVTRTIGPFPNKYVSSIAVDAVGNLYVAMNPDTTIPGTPPIIRVYAPDANGKPLPLKTITPQLAGNGNAIMAITTYN
jgi:hypothetical protein